MITIEDEIISEVNIYSFSGQQVLMSIISNNSIDISGLPHGAYIIEVVLKDVKVRQKLIVN